MDKEEPWVEMMVPIFKAEEASAATVVEEVGDYFFIQSSTLANSLRETLRILNQEQIFVEVGPRELLQLAGVSQWGARGPWTIPYFAYGSNMATAQIEPRLGEVKFVKPVELKGYKLTFNIKGNIFDNDVANIVRGDIERDSVWGALYLLDDVAVERLDFYEGVGQGEYDKVWLEIEGRKTLVYCKPALDREPGLPATDYIKKMIDGAQFAGLPTQYVADLKTYLREREVGGNVVS
jgi:hypothetical protein